MTDADALKWVMGIIAVVLSAALIALAKWLRGVDKSVSKLSDLPAKIEKLEELPLKVARIEWQLTAMATDASKALRNPHAASDRMKVLLARFEESKLEWDEIKELVVALEGMKKDEQTPRADKALISTVLREIERRYGL